MSARRTNPPMDPLTDAGLDNAVAEYLRNCKRPIDMAKLVAVFAKKGHSAFETKEAVWRLLDRHDAELTDRREILAVA